MRKSVRMPVSGAGAGGESCQETVRVRHAVDLALVDLEPGALVLVACSGGPDSCALAAATAFIAIRRGLRIGAVVVDHGLQQGSAEVADSARGICVKLGIDEVDVIRVQVGDRGGPEAAARDARYAALRQQAQDRGAQAVLLGHTLDDQAETVLLRLARGSGARSLSGMRGADGLWRRPLLGLPRQVVHACAAEALDRIGEGPWHDPHNDDPRFARPRVRAAMGILEDALGTDPVSGLARTAELLRDDADALDAIAERARCEHVQVESDDTSCEATALASLPRAVRTRVIRAMCLEAGCDPGALGAEHVWTVERLVTHWHGQGPTQLPGGVWAERRCGRLAVHRPSTRE